MRQMQYMIRRYGEWPSLHTATPLTLTAIALFQACCDRGCQERSRLQTRRAGLWRRIGLCRLDTQLAKKRRRRRNRFLSDARVPGRRWVGAVSPARNNAPAGRATSAYEPPLLLSLAQSPALVSRASRRKFAGDGAITSPEERSTHSTRVRPR
jgi:hypothetical protein